MAAMPGQRGERELTSVLVGPNPPTWVIVNGATLGTWGVDPREATLVQDAKYHEVLTS
jgi:hypothetical protein